MTDAERSELMDEIDAAAKMPATDPITALIEADKKRLLDVPDETENLTYALNFIAAAANAMPAIVAMVDENADLRYKEGELASELQRTREVNERLRSQLPEGMRHCTIVFEECPQGHGSLRGTNWIKHDCPHCKINGLRAENERLRAELAGLKEELSVQEKNLIGYQNAANYWKDNYDKSQAELGECRKALVDIANLDASVDSDEGYNEWGEADCFNQSQKIARTALAQQKGKEEGT